MERRFDYIVVGSGIAGLFYALKVATNHPGASIAIVTKKRASDTNTNRAQGGIAAVLSSDDSVKSHVADTLECGRGLCHPEVVKRVIEAGPKVVDELIDLGVKFTQTTDGLALAREGGHSVNRVAHADDLTGQEIERALIAACEAKNNNITFFANHIVLDLIRYRENGVRLCAGAYVFSEQERTFDAFYAPVTMLATGGLGQIYYHTSNPKIATGDGIAIAHRAGVSVANLEFIQFHPTTLYAPGRWPFLISEAVRGEGGILRSVYGRKIMESAHPLGDLAPRDIVARMIDKELNETGEEYVLLDISHRDADFIKKRFPNIYSECLRYGFDITKRDIPVVPAAHYACGGVICELDGTTSLPGLYVAGEVAMTGMHGANRLASNSLLEAVVMAQFASTASIAYVRQSSLPEVVPVDNTLYSSLSYPREKILLAHDRRQLSRVMSDFVGIVRSDERLGLALEKVSRIKQAIEQYYYATPATYAVVELRNIATVAELVIKSAQIRRESRGLHYLESIPDPSDDFLKDTIIPGLDLKD